MRLVELDHKPVSEYPGWPLSTIQVPEPTETVALPVTELFAVSVTDMICVPTVSSTRLLKVWAPRSPALKV